jgi:hypothetical protein
MGITRIVTAATAHDETVPFQSELRVMRQVSHVNTRDPVG